ncbi:ATP-binding protein [Massilia suwonensis]|uniref:histidine kinase n=1 Tax=Massilia suwonensis TaxID=648895 RepID=A0ABW0MQS4_9BURK
MKTSLQYRLSVSISFAVVAVAAIAAAFTFAASWKDAHLAQDKQLRQTAYLIGRIQARPVTLAARQRIAGIGREERIVVRFLEEAGDAGPAARDEQPRISRHLPDGIQTIGIGNESWRVFVMSADDGMRVAVAQQTTVRDAVAVRSALRSLLPFALLAPVLVLLVGLLTRKLFRPMRKLAVETRQRRGDDLSQLEPAGLPDEVQPFVAEINRLLMRVERVVDGQRRFVADAAHELRSPLTALSLQAERLAAAQMPAEARRRMLALTEGLQRTRLMLDQLLALARSQQGGGEASSQVSLQQAIRLVIEDLYPLAEERGIDLGVVGDDDASVAIEPLDLLMLVKNLVDNAIRYSPRGGQVDVQVLAANGPVEVVVEDTGPGIPEDERDRVFDAFYRVPGNGQEGGSGLGLAIVRAVANKANATVTLADRQGQQGLRVAVRFMR